MRGRAAPAGAVCAQGGLLHLPLHLLPPEKNFILSGSSLELFLLSENSSRSFFSPIISSTGDKCGMRAWKSTMRGRAAHAGTVCAQGAAPAPWEAGNHQPQRAWIARFIPRTWQVPKIVFTAGMVPVRYMPYRRTPAASATRASMLPASLFFWCTPPPRRSNQ